MYLKQIKTVRFQSHREVVINLSHGQLNGFIGDNSNGKSVIRKALKYVITGSIKSPAIRKSAISNKIPGNTWAEVWFTRSDDLTFMVHIDLEASKTYHMFIYPDGREQRANLSSKTLPFYVEEFGFHYDPVTGRSLSFFDPEAPLLFFHTDPKGNYSILESTRSDSTSERVKENLVSHQKEIKLKKKAVEREIEINRIIIDNLTYQDPMVLAQKYSSLQGYLGILKHVYLPNIKPLEPVPNVTVVSMYTPQFREFKNPTIVTMYRPKLTDATPLYAEIQSLENYECPYCKRKFV